MGLWNIVEWKSYISLNLTSVISIFWKLFQVLLISVKDFSCFLGNRPSCGLSTVVETHKPGLGVSGHWNIVK